MAEAVEAIRGPSPRWSCSTCTCRRRRGGGDPTRASEMERPPRFLALVGLRRRRGRDRRDPGGRARLRDQEPSPAASSRTRSPGDGGDAVFSPRLAGFVLDAFAGPAPQPSPELDELTPREREVLQHIARGYMYKEIALRLDISPETVEAHVSSVLRKLQLSTPPRADALGRGARARAVSLGVRAALVGDGEVPGDVTIEDGRMAGSGWLRRDWRPRRAGVRRPPGERVRRHRLPDDRARRLRRAGGALAAAGVTAYQPTLISAPPGTTSEALGGGPAAAERSPVRLVGVHLEGPFLTPRGRRPSTPSICGSLTPR